MFLCFYVLKLYIVLFINCFIIKKINKENKEVIDQELKEKYKKLNQEELNDQFIDACAQGQLEIIKYLLTSPKLKKHANIHDRNDWGFIGACEQGRLEVVKYLIIDMNIDKTIHIEKKLNQNKNNKYVQQAIELFNTRDLHHQLNENIKDNKERVKKMKI